MNGRFVLSWMIFMHIVDDYYLQKILAQMKQKKWWKENAPDRMYKYDYLVALFMHSFSWAFMIMLPIAYTLDFNVTAKFDMIFVANQFVHGIVDHMKANEFKINLIQDQAIHILQILVTFTLFGGSLA